MENEIKMPAGIAQAVIDAIDGMMASGNWFSDRDDGHKLLVYLADNHPTLCESGILLAIQKRSDPPML
jgi:hypothetical protein